MDSEWKRSSVSPAEPWQKTPSTGTRLDERVEGVDTNAPDALTSTTHAETPATRLEPLIDGATPSASPEVPATQTRIGHSRHLRAVSAPAAARKSEPRRSRIIAVGGGKGGVGKSLVTSSLGITLARQGKRVVVIDADLGGANLHTCLGLSSPERTLSDFITRRAEGIEDVILETAVPGLGLISGAHDHLAASNLKHAQKMRLLSRIGLLEADFVLIDIGAGISFNIVDFFLVAEQGLLVVTPEPSSIENAYRFLKMAFYRHLWRSLKESDARKTVEQAMDEKNSRGIRTPFDLLDSVERIDPPTGKYLKARALQFRPRLVINQVRYAADESVGRTMALVCQRHLGIDVDAIGAVRFDENVWRANRKRRPFLLDYPQSEAGEGIESIAQAILSSKPTTGAVLEEVRR